MSGINWVATDYNSLPQSQRLVLGTWVNGNGNKAALVRYNISNGWQYIDESSCAPPDFWMPIPLIPPLNAVKPLRLCDNFNCNNYAVAMHAQAPATNSHYCQKCLNELASERK